MKETHNYDIIKGETLTIYNVWYDNDGNVNDLTGYTGNMVIYDRNETELATVPLTFNASGEIEGSAATAAWAKGTYEYYMRVTSPASFVSDLITGRVCVE